MRKVLGLLALLALSSPAEAQRVLSLDSCRAMALRNNKQLSVARIRQDIAANMRKSARTKYLPHISATGAYMHTSREVSILSDEQKQKIASIGSSAAAGIGGSLGNLQANMTDAQKQALEGLLNSFGLTTEQMMGGLNAQLGGLASSLDGVGQGIVDAFHTDNRNMFAASVMLTQPIFMGGSITAMNKMAKISERMAANTMEAQRHATLYSTDQAYWTVVSLKHKKKLAESYLELVSKLCDDVDKMIREGVATRSEGLSVAVKVNEAEMTLIQVDDGLALARMLLCQLCGMPLDEEFTLHDEDRENLAPEEPAALPDLQTAVENRPELKLLDNAISLSKQATNLLRAGSLPQVMLTGGYTVTNPNVYDGYRNKFGGVWNIGVMLRIPVWNWGDVAYKVRAAKNATAIAELEKQDAREMIELQVSQNSFKVGEANKKLKMAAASTARAEENLRIANLGFSEGVMPLTTVMEAQTAWLQAQSQKIDAEIDVRLSNVNLKKALGTLE